jgi:DUF4097 and DUF4098 domain-containing protein YvlB
MLTRQCVGQLAVVLAVTVVAVAADQSRKEFKFTVGPQANISIQNEYGPITVKPSNSNQVVVTAILHSDKVEVLQSQNGDRVELRSHLLSGATPESGSVEYDVIAPVDARISVHSTNGPLRAEQLRGELTFEGDTSAVEIHDVVTPHLHVSTLNGPVTLTNVVGRVEINSVGGEVTLNSVTGPLVSVSSTSGRIHYNGDFGIGGDYKLVSHTGDIEAVVPADASLDVNAYSVRGDVQNDFPLSPKSHLSFLPKGGRSLFGTAGKATSAVFMRTFSGKIRLKKR